MGRSEDLLAQVALEVLVLNVRDDQSRSITLEGAGGRRRRRQVDVADPDSSLLLLLVLLHVLPGGPLLGVHLHRLLGRRGVSSGRGCRAAPSPLAHHAAAHRDSTCGTHGQVLQRRTVQTVQVYRTGQVYTGLDSANKKKSA